MSQTSEVFRAGVGEFRPSVVAASKTQTRDWPLAFANCRAKWRGTHLTYALTRITRHG